VIGGELMLNVITEQVGYSEAGYEDDHVDSFFIDSARL
jgi:hypothetical protein